jgi:nucleotide sugar dehydrogenase
MKKEKLGVIGQGFVGSAVRYGMKNHFDIFAYDKDPEKFSNAGSIFDVVEKTELTFLCVPTPMMKSGECDLRILHSALFEIADCAKALKKDQYIVVIKSTIPPGTTEKLNSIYSNLDIVFNPEFLTEANAINDYMNQNRIIVGGERPGSTRVKQIFAKAFPNVPIIKTSSTIAETIKYVTNTFLAMKVSYANEIYQLCKGLDIDYDKVIEYARYDDRLGNSHWSVPGPDGDFGFGGHCFPKDIAALQYLAKSLGVDSTMLAATIEKNNQVRTDLDWTTQVGRAVSAE